MDSCKPHKSTIACGSGKSDCYASQDFFEILLIKQMVDTYLDSISLVSLKNCSTCNILTSILHVPLANDIVYISCYILETTKLKLFSYVVRLYNNLHLTQNIQTN